MGLLTIIRKQKLKDKDLRIIVLGLDNAGKSTIVHSLLGSPEDTKISPTLGFEIHSLQHKGYNLNFWDIGGQESIRAFWFNYFFDKFDCIVFVIDLITIRTRLNEIHQEFIKLLDNEKFEKTKFIIVLNKMDLFQEDQFDQVKEEIIEKLQLKRYIVEYEIVMVSGKTGRNVPGILDKIV
ncbi:hypothetical protein WICPIJ_001687 [Wickerhamomyces pijperi]|uniref:Uncharacterized protein n=1 Tax=Wickerhamomyces pijperi TaxID=599730 RepID=A0A9P8QB72_WICPI|nr:hypothetical protein WICPIJ_001687 [Wickerhamomyces pijperi]